MAVDYHKHATIQQPLEVLRRQNDFSRRHLGLDSKEQDQLLTDLNLNSIEALITETIPENIRLDSKLNIPSALTEVEALAYLKQLGLKNKIAKSYLGMGYYGTTTPAVIVRNLLENPGWYTAYTPYQPEISQGRLEMLLNFQQLIIDLTGMPVANASLLDEATAAAEAMAFCLRANKHSKNKTFFVSEDVHPQTIDVIKTRACGLGVKVVIANPKELSENQVFGVLLQYPNTFGVIGAIEEIIQQAHQQNVLVCIATDLLALTLLKSPGELGADVVIGSSQRFGVPMSFGGPHAAFFATSKKYQRLIPGRIIGVSVDSRGKPALRMALQTREQHIRREKATSNICTAQALLANIAACYAIYHGPSGLSAIAERVHRFTQLHYMQLTKHGFECYSSFFDTLYINVGSLQESIYQNSLLRSCNFRKIDTHALGVSLDELTELADLIELIEIFTGKTVTEQDLIKQDADLIASIALEQTLNQSHTNPKGIHLSQRRIDTILESPVFHKYQTETNLMRYLKHLENKDYSLVHGMIPLGSCTMKLNSSAQMAPISWPEFSNIHPFAPKSQVVGYLQLIDELEGFLKEITGFDAVSMQPNSGAQGEYTGLLTIRRYQKVQKESHRDICLIPSSAHGTNPASAAMAGMQVVVILCDSQGNIDLEDLEKKARDHCDRLSALMITYPSTHGVFEENIQQACKLIHKNGGQVYMDGANMNAQIGLTHPNKIGADVCHLNLHKTFAIPHGGGGPGMGPIGVNKHLAPYLPDHSVMSISKNTEGMGGVSAAPYGSALILLISWMYIRTLGAEGLINASKIAILNANYISVRLADYYPILYRGAASRVAHECIIDIRPIKASTGISEEDIAKRLMDYGFHAPTMSFPVTGTLMIEPTESESKEELDRFINAMIAISHEIAQVGNSSVDSTDSSDSQWTIDNNPLTQAPHTLADISAENWKRPYSREIAAFPTAYSKKNKFWPTVNRVNNTKGDRNLICACPSINEYS